MNPLKVKKTLLQLMKTLVAVKKRMEKGLKKPRPRKTMAELRVVIMERRPRKEIMEKRLKVVTTVKRQKEAITERILREATMAKRLRVEMTARTVVRLAQVITMMMSLSISLSMVLLSCSQL